MIVEKVVAVFSSFSIVKPNSIFYVVDVRSCWFSFSKQSSASTSASALLLSLLLLLVLLPVSAAAAAAAAAVAVDAGPTGPARCFFLLRCYTSATAAVYVLLVCIPRVSYDVLVLLLFLLFLVVVL